WCGCVGGLVLVVWVFVVFVFVFLGGLFVFLVGLCFGWFWGGWFLLVVGGVGLWLCVWGGVRGCLGVVVVVLLGFCVGLWVVRGCCGGGCWGGRDLFDLA
ncbi:hypothetical protein, partial [Neisseria sp. P0022.S006]|uniref:hypothetical protein n=1 Tax=Neisseria sp. P0022.S006 TaxID=3436831 RepID=UPI003F7FA7CF